MKLILVLGILVLFEIVAGNDAHNQVKSRQKRGHESHKKKEHHLSEKRHKESHVNKPAVAPSVNGHQERFHRYLDKWEKFSKPINKWQKSPLQKKDHRENAKHTFNKKERLHTHKDHKMDFRNRKQHQIEAHQNKLIKKANRNSFGNKERKLQRKEVQNHKGKWKKNHSSLKDKFNKRQNIHSKRWNSDNHRRMAKYRRYEQIHKNLEKFSGELQGRTNIKTKFDKIHPFMQRKTHFGRPAEGRSPFGRRNRNRMGPDSKFCVDRRLLSVKCPDNKREVCGSDGKTYQNRCLLMSELCKKDSKIDLKLTKRGSCDDRKILH